MHGAHSCDDAPQPTIRGIAVLDTRRYAIAPVMDGYSVKEAATVLGVPKRRVWELIARGVLSGAPEGDGGMRVFLQPRPGKPSDRKSVV